MHIDPRKAEAAAQLLRDEGYSSAWILDDLDPTEAMFLVPRDESGFVGPFAPDSNRELELRLAALLHRKVAIAPYREVPSAVRLY